jgi:hypothetical protein
MIRENFDENDLNIHEGDDDYDDNGKAKRTAPKPPKKKKNKKKRDAEKGSSDEENKDDEDGKETVEEKIPDHLTEVEIMAMKGKKGKLGQMTQEEKESDAQEYLEKASKAKKGKKPQARKYDQSTAVPKDNTENILAELEEPKEPVYEEFRERQYKCVKCKWGSDDQADFKEHYKCGWHKHNVSLIFNESEVITEDNYNELVLMLRLKDGK